MRLIDADALYASLAELYERFGCEPREVHFSLLDMEMNIRGEETIDAEPVVRCKDCKHYWDGAGMCCFADMPINDSVKTEDYCSRGERREDE